MLLAEELIFGSAHTLLLKPVCSTGESQEEGHREMGRLGKDGPTPSLSELRKLPVPVCVLFVRERERENNSLLVVKGYRSKKKHRGNVRKMFLVSTGTAVN